MEYGRKGVRLIPVHIRSNLHSPPDDVQRVGGALGNQPRQRPRAEARERAQVLLLGKALGGLPVDLEGLKQAERDAGVWDDTQKCRPQTTEESSRTLVSHHVGRGPEVAVVVRALNTSVCGHARAEQVEGVRQGRGGDAGAGAGEEADGDLVQARRELAHLRLVGVEHAERSGRVRHHSQKRRRMPSPQPSQALAVQDVASCAPRPLPGEGPGRIRLVEDLDPIPGSDDSLRGGPGQASAHQPLHGIQLPRCPGRIVVGAHEALPGQGRELVALRMPGVRSEHRLQAVVGYEGQANRQWAFQPRQ
mmetsp:Transcript_94/g.321  ORF Transcript_94/g.321 Transcript_94/m.321 type:complete len:305 (-) Transcript_94:653-1567(-)|eukprot:CAMPEP_0183528402 /NCGR_PEP_ID=MMETSP0371-20130417/22696_1 /TAXON_ID=268820 /ORGANISM="Peridinium aciculiferum, Strain PAER-2" /LENGTH=304 /DNA_ID=CAMNT_0025728019 /DNA_START=167 /DNA_END=1081 /DNA_ORIENTATION=-